ncbi:MAG: ATP-binding protein [Dongiaceae bacterium]
MSPLRATDGALAGPDLEPLLALSPDPMLVLSPEGRVLRANPAWQRLVDAAASPATFVAAVAAEDRPRALALLRRLAAGEQVRDELLRLSPADGQHHLVEWSGAGTGGLACLVGRDVTQERRRDGLAAAEQRVLRALADSLPLPQILDLVCRAAEAALDGALCSVLLLSRDGARLQHGAAPSLPAAYSAAIDGLVIGPARGSCGTAAWLRQAVIVEDIDSDPVWADFKELGLAHDLRACWSTPLLSRGGEVLGTFAVYRREPHRPQPWELEVIERLTASTAIAIQRKRLDEALVAEKQRAELASRSKSEFLANTSHELRTPLNAVLGFSEIMRGEMLGPLGHPRYREFAADIHESGLHLLAVINDLLDLSRIEAGRLELQEETLAIPELLASVQRLVRQRADQAQLTLDVVPADGLPAIRADRRALRQILLNLLSNAIKFTPAGGHVALEAVREADGGISFLVRDTGIGIAAADIPKAMEPFGQVDSSLARKYQGAGLGLPISQALVEQHGGRLGLESAPGIGTTARVRLPPERTLRG